MILRINGSVQPSAGDTTQSPVDDRIRELGSESIMGRVGGSDEFLCGALLEKMNRAGIGQTANSSNAS